MTNRNVYLKKLGLSPEFLSDPHVDLMLRKPGTLSKKEKKWLIAYVAVLELKSFKPQAVSRTRLSADFIRSLHK